MYYCVDKKTGKRPSLYTSNEDEAKQIVEAKNHAQRQPVLNLQIAKAYMAGTDNGIKTRTWQHAIEALIEHQARRQPGTLADGVPRTRPCDSLLPRVIIETQGEAALEGSASRHGFHQRLLAPAAQLLRGHELAALAADSQAAMAAVRVQEQARHHLGGTLQNCRTGEEPGAEGVLSTGLASRARRNLILRFWKPRMWIGTARRFRLPE